MKTPITTTETASQIVRRSGSNLAFALAVLPPEKRADMEVFYGFCRVIDDIADDTNLELHQRQKGLDHWRSIVAGLIDPQAGVETEFRQLMQKYDLEEALLNEIIYGVAMDLQPVTFETQDDLLKYCYRVASAVGLVSIEIFGYKNPATKEYAKQLGYALQWTNILRDVGEDAAEGRVYLPLKDLSKYGLDKDQILSGAPDKDAFRKMMAEQSQYARALYQVAQAALHKDDKDAMRSPELMRRIYFGILEKMENDNFRVYDKRYRLSKMRMLGAFAKAKSGF